MADEVEKKEEVKVDAEVLDSAIKEGEDETKDEISEEVLETQKKFDDQIDSDDDDTAIDETASDEKTPEEKAAEEKSAEEEAAKADDDDSGKKKAAEQTAEDKEIEEAAKVLEEQSKVEEQKTDDQRLAEKVAADKKDAEDKAKAEEAKDEPFDCGLATEGDDAYEPELVENINKLGQSLMDDKKALKQENTELRNLITNQANERNMDWLDNKIIALGEDFHEILGEGEIDDIEPGSKQFESRISIGRRMAVVANAHQKLNKPIPSRAKLFKSAVSYLHKDILNKSETEKETVNKLAERKGQVIGRGSKKVSAQAAADKVKKTMSDFDSKIDDD